MWWSLPSSPLRHDLAGFGLVVAVFAGVLVGLVAWLINPWLSLLALGVAAVVGAVVGKNPASILPLYRIWNAAARTYASILARAITLMALATVVIPAGVGLRSGAPSGESSYWSARTSQRTDTYPSQHTSGPASTRPGWIRDYLQWARVSGNSWAIVLAPYLWLLRHTEQPKNIDVPHDIYTLY